MFCAFLRGLCRGILLVCAVMSVIAIRDIAVSLRDMETSLRIIASPPNDMLNNQPSSVICSNRK